MKQLARDFAQNSSNPTATDKHVKHRVGHGAESHQQICAGHVGDEEVRERLQVRLGGHDVDYDCVTTQREDEDHAIR